MNEYALLSVVIIKIFAYIFFYSKKEFLLGSKILSGIILLYFLVEKYTGNTLTETKTGQLSYILFLVDMIIICLYRDKSVEHLKNILLVVLSFLVGVFCEDCVGVISIALLCIMFLFSKAYKIKNKAFVLSISLITIILSHIEPDSLPYLYIMTLNLITLRAYFKNNDSENMTVLIPVMMGYFINFEKLSPEFIYPSIFTSAFMLKDLVRVYSTKKLSKIVFLIGVLLTPAMIKGVEVQISMYFALAYVLVHSFKEKEFLDCCFRVGFILAGLFSLPFLLEKIDFFITEGPLSLFLATIIIGLLLMRLFFQLLLLLLEEKEKLFKAECLFVFFLAFIFFVIIFSKSYYTLYGHLILLVLTVLIFFLKENLKVDMLGTKLVIHDMNDTNRKMISALKFDLAVSFVSKSLMSLVYTLNSFIKMFFYTVRLGEIVVERSMAKSIKDIYLGYCLLLGVLLYLHIVFS